MNPANCKITIQRLTGDEDSKLYTEVYINVKALIQPTTNEIAVMYEVPIGSSFSFSILEQVDSLEPADRFIVTSEQQSGLTDGDTLMVQGNSKKMRMLGHFIYQGVCIKL